MAIEVTYGSRMTQFNMNPYRQKSLRRDTVGRLL
jgi:hypothetical protein